MLHSNHRLGYLLLKFNSLLELWVLVLRYGAVVWTKHRVTVFLASRKYQLNKSSLGYTFILGTLLIILIFYYWSWRTSFAEIDLSLQHMCTRKSFLFSPALSKVKIVLSSVPKRFEQNWYSSNIVRRQQNKKKYLTF